MDAEFDKIVGDRKIAIYGAGVMGKIVYSALLKHGYQVAFFFQGRGFSVTDGQMLYGVPVIYASSLNEEERRSTLILHALFAYFPDKNSVDNYVGFSKDLDAFSVLGYDNLLSYLDLFRFFPEDLRRTLWIAAPKTYDLFCDDNLAVLWQDSPSCEIYTKTMQARLACDMRLLPNPQPLEYQYFPEDIPLGEMKSFVDCGAFIGDTLQNYVNYAKKCSFPIESYFAFEPDSENIIALTDTVRRLCPKDIKNAVILPCGVGAKNEQLRFTNGCGLGSHLLGTNEWDTQCATDVTTIQISSIDNTLLGIPVDYIKMDIEGAEYDALLGAELTIRQHRPNLAICVYHRPEDIFTIPMLIDGWHLGYKFWLRQYSADGLDLVLYATVK